MAVYAISLISLVIMILLLIFGSKKRPYGFIIFLLVSLFWMGTQFIAQYITYANQALSEFMLSVSIMCAALMPPALNIFVTRLANAPYRNIFFNILSVMSVFIGIAVISPMGQLNIQVSRQGITVTSENPLYLILIIMILTAFITTIAIIKKYKNAKLTTYDNQALSMLSNAFILATAIIFVAAVFFAEIEYAQVLTPISITALSVVALVAIFKHKLFDVRPFIARSFAYTISIFIVVLLFTVSAFTLSNLYFDSQITIEQELFFGLFSALIALLFQPIKAFFDKFSNKLFYRDAYDPQSLINDINSILVNTTELDTLLTNTSGILVEKLNISSAEFILYKQKLDSLASNYNTQLNNAIKNKQSKIIDIEMSNELSSFVDSNNISHIVKLVSSAQQVGVLVVGRKKSGTHFTSQDLQLLEIIADEVAIAVQNALRFEEISQFNVTLQKKIENATQQLQKSNEKLQKLDEAKDEFISMASHQLRTPLTSVKGYISMLLEGDAGKLNTTQKRFLDQAFLSSQRMVYLIADLLNASRLQTGKFVIETAPTYLPDVVESEISQLYGTAKAREVTLSYEKPSTFPTIPLDETKIRQVIMNFADNAIYYTPKGGHITVALQQHAGHIEFTVTDTGIGIPKKEQHRLFTKFYRADNAKKARPDGTGLGLYMAKKVIVAQGGSIIFSSQESKGSTFGFSFPLPVETLETTKA